MNKKNRWIAFWVVTVVLIVTIVSIVYWLSMGGKKEVVGAGGADDYDPIGIDDDEVDEFIDELVEDVMHPENDVCLTIRDGNMFKKESQYMTIPKDRYGLMLMRYRPEFDKMQSDNSGFSIFYRIRRNGPDGHEIEPGISTKFKIARDGRQSDSSHPLVWEIDPLTCTFKTQNDSTSNTFVIKQGQWHDVLISYQIIPLAMIKVRVIVDGEVVTEESGEFELPAESSPNFVVGAATLHNLPLVESFSIRDVALYKDPLFEKGKPMNTLNDSYELESLIETVRKTPTKVKNLFVYYRLGVGDSPETSRAHDMSVNCFHGDLVGAAQFEG